MERELVVQVPDGGVVPYVTAAESSTTLAAANNTITTGTILAPGGFIGSAEITEVGVKSSLLDERLFLTLARYQQTRTDISNPEDPTEGADITSSETTGIEFELKWVPSRDVFVSVFALLQESDYIFASNGNIAFDGRMLGFQDVVDPATGEVIYPAEAFIYGGKAQIDLPASLTQQYLRRNGNPEEQFGVNASYQVTRAIRLQRRHHVVLGDSRHARRLPDRARGLYVEPRYDVGRRRLARAAERLQRDGRDAAPAAQRRRHGAA